MYLKGSVPVSTIVYFCYYLDDLLSFSQGPLFNRL